MTNSVQKTKPIRTCTKTYTRYTSFKPFIREDFNRRCGYCDDLDILYNGGVRSYQIDHFKPKKFFPELETDYNNLVYCCPFCNRAKWDKWREQGFIDPCTDLYDEHLERDSNGEIKYKSLRGKYSYKNLNLCLKRHELLWMIEKIIIQKEKLLVFKKTLERTHPKYIEIIELYIGYDEKLIQYTNLFYNEI